ncbi:MAG: NAD(P)/FAD-dependent oxidoreductase [Flavobacteriales bacterium]
MSNIVIIGNGISGITAARHIRKLSAHAITVISAESEHFFSRTALMYVYMGHMKWEHLKPYEDFFWKKNRINLIFNKVEQVLPTENKLKLSNGEEMLYDTLILATGSKPAFYNWSGQDALGVQGLYSKQDLETMEQNTKDINRGVIVGGGLIGIEVAEMLRSRNIDVTFLVRESAFWNNVIPMEEAKMIGRHIREHHVDLKLQTELKEVLKDDNNRVKSVVTNTGEEVPCEFVAITTGVTPSIDFLKNSGIETNRGVLVDEYLKTNFENIYAIGDCAEIKSSQPGRRAIEQVWYTGRMMGETVAINICKKPVAYNPGIWFNSAKFFDIEYQTYGNVPAVLSEEIDSFYWEDSERKLAFRVVYNKQGKEVIGMHSFGIRLRHPVCDKWIRSKTTVNEVMRNIYDAHFDPEFYKTYYTELVNKYNTEKGENVSLNNWSIKRMLGMA